MSNLALEIKNITKKYKDFTLDDVSFSLEKGSVMGLIGQNGAGKTTIIKLIMNSIGKNSGKINVFDMDNVGEEVAVKTRVGYVADEDYLYINANLKAYAKAYSIMFPQWDSYNFV